MGAKNCQRSRATGKKSSGILGQNPGYVGVIIARQWGIIQSPSGGRSATTGAFPHQNVSTLGDNNRPYRETEYSNVPVEVEANERLYPVTMTLGVRHNNSYIIGAPTIGSLRKAGQSASFK